MKRFFTWLRQCRSIHDGAATGLLLLLPFLVFWQIWAPNAADRLMFRGDILMGAYPTRVFVHNLFSTGTMPLWNPYQLGGMPVLGDVQIAPFYSFNLLLELLFLNQPIPYMAIELLAIAHYALGACLLYGYLRALGVRPTAALVGAIAFEFNGFFVGHRGHYNMLAVVAWLPGVLWFLDKAWQAAQHRRALLWTLLASLALSQLTMAGHPQVTYYCALAIGGYVLYRWIGQLRQGRTLTWQQHLRIPLLFALAGIVAVGLAAIALLPVAELLSRSLRSAPTYDFSTQYSLLPRNLIGLLMPDFLGWGVTEYRIYAGILTLALAAVAWFVPTQSRPERFVFTLMAIMGLVVALGGFTIFHGIIYRFVPGFDAVRVSARAFYFTNLALAVLAAFGTEILLEQLSSAERRRFRFIVRAIGAILATTLLLGTALYLLLLLDFQQVNEEFFFSENLFSAQPDPEATFALLTRTVNVYLLFALFLGGTALLLWLRLQNRLTQNRFVFAATLLIFLDVATYAPHHDTLKADPETAHFTIKNYTTELLDAPWQVSDQQQLVSLLQELPPYVRVDNRAEVLPDNYSMVHQIAFATGYNILDFKQRFQLLTQWPYLSPTMRYDLLNTGYILTAAETAEPPEADAILLVRNSQGALWKRARQPAYARFATQIRPISTLVTVNGLLNLPGQELATQPAVAPADEDEEAGDLAGSSALHTLLAESWPEAVAPTLFAIGTTGTTSPVDIAVLAGGPIKYSAVIVNGIAVTPQQRGMVIALIEPTSGELLATHGFDTYLSTTESDRLAAVIKAAPQGTIVALATYDEGFTNLNDAARTAIAGVGAATELTDQSGNAYAVVGVKGARQGTAVEALDAEAVMVDIGSGALAATAASDFKSEVLRYQPNQITLAVETQVRGLLIINEPVYPGWQAYLNGVPTTTLRANGLLRAIILPPSPPAQPHEVSFVYAPASARLGAALSLVTLTLVGALLLVLLMLALPWPTVRGIGALAPQVSSMAR